MTNAFDLAAKLFTVEVKESRTPMYRTNGLVAAVHRPHAITVTGRVQGGVDMHRRDALKRGGI